MHFGKRSSGLIIEIDQLARRIFRIDYSATSVLFPDCRGPSKNACDSYSSHMTLL